MTTTTRRGFLRGLLQPPFSQSLPVVMVGGKTAVSADPIHHLLNRISWGPRPGEVAQAQAVGYAATLESQLDPDSIDDSEAEARLADIPILHLSRHDIYRLENDYRVWQMLLRGMIARAVTSRRQLLERMVEFWSDHFNISAEGFANEYVAFQRDVVRPHALGSFRDLLIETAKSPAMLQYLDNYVNLAEHPNENYARELLELHTLGVDGGYTETDVKEVARAFTGWTVANKTRTGFYFEPYNHDTGMKRVLGHTLPTDRGIEDGLQVLSILASHPSTAVFLSRKLCVRFVSDNPPDSLVAAVTAVWQQTQGDIKAVLRAIFLSDEFLQSAGQKLRRPLDFFIGALRATGTEIRYQWLLEEMLNELGQPPYGWHPPNGYPDVAGAWSSSGGLLARWNVAMRLTHGAYSDSQDFGYGLATPLRERIGEPQTAGELVDAVAAQVFGVPLAGSDRAAFVEYVAEGGGEETAVSPRLLGRKLGSLYGLMLASPQYQWR
ncbi:MAG: DUF1800 domain-containing protein [Ardenticatenaceae bacterium]|nr:DUF1800 domain-containing protein [Ardenticatenaceae bacterium]